MHFNRQSLYVTLVFCAQQISGSAIDSSQAAPNHTLATPFESIPPPETILLSTSKTSIEPTAEAHLPSHRSIHHELRQLTGATGLGETASGPTLFGATASGATAGGATASGALASGALSSGALSSGSIASGAASRTAVTSGAIPSETASYGAFSSMQASQSAFILSTPVLSASFSPLATPSSSVQPPSSSAREYASQSAMIQSSSALFPSSAASTVVSESSAALSASVTPISLSSSSQTIPTILVTTTTRNTVSRPTSRASHTTSSQSMSSMSTSTSKIKHVTPVPSRAATDDSSQSSDSMKPISHAAVAGIATGVAAGAVMVALGGLYLYRRGKQGKPLFGPRGSQRSQNSVYPKVAWLYDPNMDSPPHSRSASGDAQFLIPGPRPGVAEMEAGLASPDMRPSRSSSPLLPPTITLTRDDWPGISPEGSPNRAGGRRSRPMMSIHEENE